MSRTMTWLRHCPVSGRRATDPRAGRSTSSSAIASTRGWSRRGRPTPRRRSPSGRRCTTPTWTSWAHRRPHRSGPRTPRHGLHRQRRLLSSGQGARRTLPRPRAPARNSRFRTGSPRTHEVVPPRTVQEGEGDFLLVGQGPTSRARVSARPPRATGGRRGLRPRRGVAHAHRSPVLPPRHRHRGARPGPRRRRRRPRRHRLPSRRVRRPVSADDRPSASPTPTASHADGPAFGPERRQRRPERLRLAARHRLCRAAARARLQPRAPFTSPAAASGGGGISAAPGRERPVDAVRRPFRDHTHTHDAGHLVPPGEKHLARPPPCFRSSSPTARAVPWVTDVAGPTLPRSAVGVLGAELRPSQSPPLLAAATEQLGWGPTSTPAGPSTATASVRSPGPRGAVCGKHLVLPMNTGAEAVETASRWLAPGPTVSRACRRTRRP